MDKLYCKDLMIDDWVYVPRLKKQVRVGAVYKTMIVPNPLDDNIHVSIGEEYIEPIPLTSEILEKNGFKQFSINSHWYEQKIIINSEKYAERFSINIFIGEDICLDIETDVDRHTTAFRSHILYVHQLQHALKLCGIKKEIIID